MYNPLGFTIAERWTLSVLSICYKYCIGSLITHTCPHIFVGLLKIVFLVLCIQLNHILRPESTRNLCSKQKKILISKYDPSAFLVGSLGRKRKLLGAYQFNTVLVQWYSFDVCSNNSVLYKVGVLTRCHHAEFKNTTPLKRF